MKTSRLFNKILLSTTLFLSLHLSSHATDGDSSRLNRKQVKNFNDEGKKTRIFVQDFKITVDSDIWINDQFLSEQPLEWGSQITTADQLIHSLFYTEHLVYSHLEKKGLSEERPF